MIAADLVILAVEALEVAAGEEDVTDPRRAGDRRFLPPVEAEHRRRKALSDPAAVVVFCLRCHPIDDL